MKTDIRRTWPKMQGMPLAVFLFSASFCLIFSCSLAFARGAGTTAAAFLKINPGARAAGMADAFCAISDDVNAINFNPAGLVQVKQRQISLSHNEWIEGVRNESLGYCHPLGDAWSMGFMVHYVYVGDIVARDILGVPTGDTFGSQNYEAALSLARKVSDNLSVGVNAKHIYESIYTESDSAFAADAGVLCAIRHFRMGVSLQNIGSRIALYEDAFELPRNLTAGVSYSVSRNSNISVDCSNLLEDEIDIKAGAEYRVIDMLALRGGFMFNRSENTGPGVTAGLGFFFKELSLDYGFLPFGDLGTVHRISLAMKFGKKKNAEPDEEW